MSVVVPFHNNASNVESCFDSLVVRDFDQYEVICIDDGSTDGTGELLDHYAGLCPFVRAFHYQCAGLSVERNRGVALARARLVTFVDGEDFVSPHYVRALYEAHGGRADRMVRASFVPSFPMGQAEGELQGLSDGLDVMRGARVIEGTGAVCRSFLLGEFPHYAWGTLAERGLYERAPFEPGV